MKLRAQLIVVPCVAFAVRTRLAAGSGLLSSIETVALRAIGLGLDDVDALAQVVGLGTRPTLDLVYDFWLRGYVLVDTALGRVRLAGDALKAFSTDTMGGLATAENNVEAIVVMQELLSGAVLPHMGRVHPLGTESSLVPTLRSGLDLEGVTSGELLDAVRREVVRQSRKQGRDLAVQEAWVEPDQILVEAAAGRTGVQQRRFLPVWADIQQDPDSGRLLFDLVEAPDLAPPTRQAMERSLSLLAEQMPGQLFFKRLRQEFERAASLDAPTTRDGALARLRRTAAGLDSTDRGVLEARHAQLREAFEDASQEVRAIARAEARVRVLIGYEEHEAEIRRLIDAAKRQIVLANPWIGMVALVQPPPGADQSWFDLLNAALGRGVQVFLLWGIAPDSTLDVKTATALSDLVAKHPGRLVLSRRSSTLHAKFVVRDAHEAVVTSFNFLDPPKTRDSLELGLHVRGCEDDQAPEAVLDLLEWSRGAFPDYLAARRILLLPQELDASEPEPPTLPAAPEVPAAEATFPVEGRQAPAIRYWAASWRSVVERLLAISHARVPGARLVVDREHRESLWRALRDSEHRLAILSDRVSVDVVTDRFVRMVGAKLDAGVSCAFLFRREGATDQGSGPASRLKQVADRSPERCKLVEALSHAKILVSDDDLVVGSFNFLSYGGEYLPGQRERAELSIQVRSSAVAERVLKALEVRWPGSFDGLIGRRPSSDGEIPASLPPRLQPLFSAIRTSGGPGPGLLAWFRVTSDPWGDLRTLERAELPAQELLQAAAAALGCCAGVDGAEATYWRAKLALWRWQAQDFVGAALLVPEGTSSEGGLPSWLALLGAEVGGAPDHLDDLATKLEAAHSRELKTMSVLLLVAVLVQGRFDALDLLERVGDRAGGSATKWVEAVRRYYHTTYQPLPMSLLRRNVDQDRRRVAIFEARAGLRAALENAENIGFRFPLGEHTWRRLRMEGYLLGELRAAHDGDDVKRLSLFLARIDGTGKSADVLMDEASHEERDEHNDHITEPKRRVCLTRLRRAMEAAREWVVLSLADAPTSAEARILEACVPLRRDLGDLRCDPTEESDVVLGPALLFARAALAPLLHMREP